MNKFLFSSVCALALCGTSVFGKALTDNDAFLDWTATPDSIDAKYDGMNTLDYWKGIEATQNLATTFETAANKVTAAKTALGVKGEGNVLTSGIYKEITDNETKMSDNKTAFETLKAVATEVENIREDLDTYFDGLVGVDGSLTAAKTEAEKALRDAKDILGVTKDGDTVTKSTGLQLAKEVNDTISNLSSETQAFITSGIELGTADDNSDGLAEGDTIFGKLNKAIKDKDGTGDEALKTDLANLKSIADSVAELKTATTSGVLKNKQANLTLDKLKTDVVSAMIKAQNSVVGEKEQVETEAKKNFNDVNKNIQAAKNYLQAKEALGEKTDDADEHGSLYAKKKFQEGLIQAAEDALGDLVAAIRDTEEFQNAGVATEPGNDGDGNGNPDNPDQGKDENGKEPSKPNKPEEKEPTEAEMVANVDEFLGAELSKGVSKAAKLELYKAVSKLDDQKAFNEQTAEVKAEVQKAVDSFATKVVESKKEDIIASASSATLVQLNNMTKRLGEIRDLNADYGVWLRSYGGRMSTDNNHLNYYSIQLGADKVSTIGDDRIVTGLLTGFDKINGDVKSKTYSVGGYVSYLHNSGAFGDVVLKYANTKHERDAHEFKKQNSFLASFEGGYRLSVNDGFYVEPSLELITGHIGKYEDKNGVNTISIDSHTPFIIKPQAFVGGNVDSFTYRAGVGGVLNTTEQEAKISLNMDDISKGLKADGKTKLDKNHHGFVSLGGSYKINEKSRFSLSAERSFGGKITNDYEINATIRFGF